MRLFKITIIALIGLLLATGAVGYGAFAQDDATPTATGDGFGAPPPVGPRDPLAATVEALQTQVADLTSRVDDLEAGAGATPVASPMASPVAAAPVTTSGPVELVYYYPAESADGGTIFRGELLNTSDRPVHTPTIGIALYDDNGKIVDAIEGYGQPDAIMPHDQVPFVVRSDVPQDEWVNAQISLGGGGYLTEDDYVISGSDLEIRNLNEISASDSHLKVTGEVYNRGTKPALYVSIVAAVYDAEGKVIDVETNYITRDRLEPGGTSAFKIDAEIDAINGWTYRLFVSGISA